jgi:hypothetical protein
MRFHHKFSRQVGGVSPDPVLGSDAVPTALADQAKDTVLTASFSNTNGVASQRIAVAYSYVGAGAPGNLPANVYIWDDLTQNWYLLNAAPLTLKPGTIQFFDCIGLPQSAPSSEPRGSLEAFVKVNAAGGDPNGVYTFALAPVLNRIGV